MGENNGEKGGKKRKMGQKKGEKRGKKGKKRGKKILPPIWGEGDGGKIGGRGRPPHPKK